MSLIRTEVIYQIQTPLTLFLISGKLIFCNLANYIYIIYPILYLRDSLFMYRISTVIFSCNPLVRIVETTDEKESIKKILEIIVSFLSVRPIFIIFLKVRVWMSLYFGFVLSATRKVLKIFLTQIAYDENRTLNFSVFLSICSHLLCWYHKINTPLFFFFFISLLSSTNFVDRKDKRRNREVPDPWCPRCGVAYTSLWKSTFMNIHFCFFSSINIYYS